VRVANSFIFKEPVFNYSADFPFVWDEIKVPVQYGSDYQLADTLLQRVAEEVVGEHGKKAKEQWKLVVRKYLIEDATTAPMISMKANDNWVEFTLRYIVDYKLRRTTQTQLFQKILKELDATNGAVKIASATFQLVEAPEIDVRVRKDSSGTSF
jgi:small-conductance mechanosensitive channel